MRAIFRSVQWTWLLAVALFLSLPTTGSAVSDDTIKKTFQVGDGGTLTIESDLGSMEVHAVAGKTVEIEVIREVDARDRDDAEEILKDFVIEFRQSGNDVYVHAEYKRWRDRSFWGGDRGRLKVSYLISVPQKYNVDLRTAGGSISVDDLTGKATTKTSGGSLHFGRIQGPVLGKTSGGSIDLAGCVGTAQVATSGGGIDIGEVDGDIDARTSGGSIRIDRAKGSVVAKTSGGGISVKEVTGNIEASTSGGSVTASISRQPTASCRLSTSGGSVEVFLASDVAVDVDAETSGGRVKTEFPVLIQGEVSKTALNAKVNGGGPELYLRTSGGNIYLRKL